MKKRLFFLSTKVCFSASKSEIIIFVFVVTLVEQQALKIEHNSSLCVGRLRGEGSFDMSKEHSRKEYKKFLDKNQVRFIVVAIRY